MNRTSRLSAIDMPADMLACLFGYWNDIRGDDDVPARASYDPFARPRLLPHVYLLETQPAGGYRVRLSGEDVNRFAGRKLTGHAIGSDLYGSAAARMLEVLDFVCLSRRPVLLRGSIMLRPDTYWAGFETLALPLVDDLGEIRQILGGWVVVNDFVPLPAPSSMPGLAGIEVIADPYGPRSRHVSPCTAERRAAR